MPSSLHFRGRLEVPAFDSAVLRGNALGDPARRDLHVYLPPQAVAGDRVPVVFVLSAFTGRPHSLLETHPWKTRPLVDLDRAMAEGACPPAILVLPDTFTRLGGSQFVNSSAVGDYEDHVVRELVPWVDAHYPTLEGRRAVVGKSSGGFGALHLGMRHPASFPVVGSISGDCHFEVSYGRDFHAAARGLEAYGRDPRAFLKAFDDAHELSGDGHAVLSLLAMSACYSPNPAHPLGFDLPIDLATGERVPAVWARWLAFDPLVACEEHADALGALDLLYLEAGKRDEFHLQFGLRVLAQRLRALGVPFEHVEFDGGHFGMDVRLPVVVPRLVRALAAG